MTERDNNLIRINVCIIRAISEEYPDLLGDADQRRYDLSQDILKSLCKGSTLRWLDSDEDLEGLEKGKVRTNLEGITDVCAETTQGIIREMCQQYPLSERQTYLHVDADELKIDLGCRCYNAMIQEPLNSKLSSKLDTKELAYIPFRIGQSFAEFVVQFFRETEAFNKTN